MIENHLFCIFFILVVLVVFKFYLQYANNNTNTTKYICNKQNCSCKYNSNKDINGLLDKMKIQTDSKINHAIEQGIIEGFSAMNGSGYGEGGEGGDGGGGDSGGGDGYITRAGDDYLSRASSNVGSNDDGDGDPSIISYINKDNQIKLMLFYKSTCHYCKEFMPVWYQIINNLPNNILYEEINTNSNKNNEIQKISDYKIINVPTIMLLINNNKIIYQGNRSYKDIERFLKENGINLVIRKFEEFDDSGYNNEPSPTNTPNKRCPDVTFDSQLDVANDKYMFQIFNSKGQYGYASGGIKDSTNFTPFNAAYSVVDSYLSSLPNKSNMTECANLYTNNIMQFGLCDEDKLNEILSYNENVNKGSANIQFEGTDYSTNTNVVKAIKNACNL